MNENKTLVIQNKLDRIRQKLDNDKPAFDIFTLQILAIIEHARMTGEMQGKGEDWHTGNFPIFPLQAAADIAINGTEAYWWSEFRRAVSVYITLLTASGDFPRLEDLKNLVPYIGSDLIPVDLEEAISEAKKNHRES